MDLKTEKDYRASGDKLRTLTSEQKPEWGQMTPQHMVEHIVGSWRISNGRAKVPPALSEKEIAERRVFLFSEVPYPKNHPNPLFAQGLQALRKSDLEAAIEQLEDEIDAFFSYHAEHPEAIEMHPVFGPLDFDGWMCFQSKHMSHHFAQFGLAF